MNHRFLVVWDRNGLEYVGDITADEQRVTWEALQGRNSPRRALANPHHLLLRARYNPQRNYEIYVVDAQEGITEQDITDMFNNDPQASADTIRNKGQCLYSGREVSKSVIT